MKHFLDLADIPSEFFHRVLELSVKVKASPDSFRSALRGKRVGLYFQKPSVRTRVSFEVGINELGAFPIMLSPTEIQIGKRESVADVAKVLSRYLDAIVMRVNMHTELVEFAEYADISIVNGLSDFSHPCQAIADVLTILEHKGKKSHRVVFFGDGNNVCNSLIKACGVLGFEMVVCCPKGYEPAISTKEVKYEVIHSPEVAARNADVIYTDVWTSMGQEEEMFVRRQVFAPYRVSEKIMSYAKPDCIFMHCLPAHRGEEVDANVIDSPQSVVFDQAENRLHAQKGILISLLGLN